MNIHEFQAKQILGRFNVPVPKGLAGRRRPEEAAAAFESLGQPKAVAQGADPRGRSRQGGRRQADLKCGGGAGIRAKLLGKPLVTHQTGPEGRVVRRIYIEQASEVARELYLGMVVDRKAESVAVIASTEGGMEIEEVAAKTPERIMTEPIDPVIGLAGFQARKIAFALG